MRNIQARALGLMMVLAVCVCGNARADDGAIPNCRSSELYEAAHSDKGIDSQDLDGDGKADSVRVTSGGGSGGSTTRVEIALSKSAAHVSFHSDFDFANFVGFYAVPAELQGDEMAKARDVVARALFPVVCDGPDPSLAWLLDRAHRLRWIPGRPEMPQMIGYYSVSPAVLARAQDSFTFDREKPAPLPRAVWVEYVGHNHRRNSDSKSERKTFDVLAERPGQQLLGTAHGVVLLDPAHHRHAWLYVQSGTQKLRWPTIFGAKFDGQHAVIDVRQGVMEQRGLVRVELETGAIAERFCRSGDWNTIAGRCPKE